MTAQEVLLMLEASISLGNSIGSDITPYKSGEINPACFRVTTED